MRIFVDSCLTDALSRDVNRLQEVSGEAEDTGKAGAGDGEGLVAGAGGHKGAGGGGGGDNGGAGADGDGGGADSGGGAVVVDRCGDSGCGAV